MAGTGRSPWLESLDGPGDGTMRPMAFQRAFLVALTAGTLLMVILREGIQDPLVGAAWATAACTVIIVVFARFFYQRSREVAVRGADNFYYLGLLFTLLSLIYVLVRVFGFGEGGTEAGTQQIIGNFGIALVSTVVGIVVRIVLLDSDQQHDDPMVGASPSPGVDPGEKASPEAVRSVDIATDLVDLRDQLRQATDGLSHFTRMTQTRLELAMSHSERLMHEFNERVDDMAQTRLRSLDAVEQAWATGTQRMHDKVEGMALDAERRLAAAVERSSDAWGQLARHAAEGSDDARQRAQATSERIAEMLETVAAVNQALEPLAAGIGAVSRSVTTLDGATNEATARLGNLSRSSESAATEIGTARRTAADQLSELHRTLSSTREVIAPLNELLSAVTDGARVVGAATEQAQNHLGEATGRIGHELGEAAEAIAAAMGSVTSAGKAFDSSTASLAGLEEIVDRLRMTATDESGNAAVEELASGVREYHQELHRQIGPWSRAIDALNDSLADQRELVEKNAAIATELLEQLKGNAERGLFGIVLRRQGRTASSRR